MLFRTKNKKMSSEPALSGEKAIRRAMVADGRVQGVGFRYFARSLAREHGVTGWVMNMPDGTVAFNPTGNAGMATAGSGDVLTGIITALLARGYNQKDACLIGMYLHGLAGDLAAEKLGMESLMAGDIIDCLPKAFIRIED